MPDVQDAVSGVQDALPARSDALPAVHHNADVDRRPLHDDLSDVPNKVPGLSSLREVNS